MNEQPAGATPTPDKRPPAPTDATPSSLSEGEHPGETQDFRGSRPRPPAPPTSVPTGPPASFGRYVVKKELGSGAFGTVFLAQDPELDRPVAIKAHRADRDIQADQLQNFIQEARRVARLRHPGIVTVH